MIRCIVCLLSILFTGCGRQYKTHRSPLRIVPHNMPTLVVSSNNTHEYICNSSTYKKYPIFTAFDQTDFIKHQIPPSGITLSEENIMISYDLINGILEDLVHALLSGHTTFPECSIIKDSNFNYKTGCGLLILKMNHYPFVIKLFREIPESFINPYGKGLESISCFFMSGGNNRHIAGFTRIPNREYIIQITKNDDAWYKNIKIPRKWYWIPQHLEWLTIKGYNIDGLAYIETKIPTVYAIIADYIENKENHFLDRHSKEKLLMDLCLLTDFHLDPNIQNFIVVQETSKTDPTLIIVDTEDHRCITGITGEMSCSNYIGWYTILGMKFLKDTFFKIKST